MLKEAILALTELAQKAVTSAQKLTFIKPPAEPEHIYYTVDDKGTVQRIEAEPAYRQHSVTSAKGIESIVRAMVTTGKAPSPVVWVSPRGIVFFPDDVTRRDFITSKLTLHPQFVPILEMASEPRRFSQKDLVHYLRVTNAGAETRSSESLLSWIRSMRREAGASGAQALGTGRESMARSVTNAWMSESGLECPPEFTLKVPIFTDPWSVNEKREVTIYIGLEGEKEAVFFLSVSPEIINWRVEAAAGIAAMLRTSFEPGLGAEQSATPVQVYDGKPGLGPVNDD